MDPTVLSVHSGILRYLKRGTVTLEGAQVELELMVTCEVGPAQKAYG